MRCMISLLVAGFVVAYTSSGFAYPTPSHTGTAILIEKDRVQGKNPEHSQEENRHTPHGKAIKVNTPEDAVQRALGVEDNDNDGVKDSYK